MKKILATTLVFALLLLIFAGCQSALATQQQDSQQASVTRDEALHIALLDAGLSEAEVYDLDIELDRDRGILHYDVDFEYRGLDYEYEIHAETGQLLQRQVPVNTEPVVTPTPEPETPPVQQEPAVTTERITREQATAAALNHAGLTREQVWDLEAELDQERGVWLYEVDFEADGYEYEYEIHAETGEILRTEKETD